MAVFLPPIVALINQRWTCSTILWSIFCVLQRRRGLGEGGGWLIIGSLSNDDGNGNENVTRKYIFVSFGLLRDYFNPLNFYKNGELSRTQIDRSGVHGKKENEKFAAVRSRSPQNLKCGNFTLLFCRGRQRNVPRAERLF